MPIALCRWIATLCMRLLVVACRALKPLTYLFTYSHSTSHSFRSYYRLMYDRLLVVLCWYVFRYNGYTVQITKQCYFKAPNSKVGGCVFRIIVSTRSDDTILVISISDLSVQIATLCIMYNAHVLNHSFCIGHYSYMLCCRQIHLLKLLKLVSIVFLKSNKQHN